MSICLLVPYFYLSVIMGEGGGVVVRTLAYHADGSWFKFRWNLRSIRMSLPFTPVVKS